MADARCHEVASVLDGPGGWTVGLCAGIISAISLAEVAHTAQGISYRGQPKRTSTNLVLSPIDWTGAWYCRVWFSGMCRGRTKQDLCLQHCLVHALDLCLCTRILIGNGHGALS